MSVNVFEVSDFLYNPEAPTESMHYKLLAEKTISSAGVAVTNPFPMEDGCIHTTEILLERQKIKQRYHSCIFFSFAVPSNTLQEI